MIEESMYRAEIEAEEVAMAKAAEEELERERAYFPWGRKTNRGFTAHRMSNDELADFLNNKEEKA